MGIIECPNCKKELVVGNELNRIHKVACKSCKKWIWYNDKTNESEIKDVPERTTSSGKRFY